MTKKVIVSAVVLALLVTGCGKKAAEKTAEKVIEKASNGNVNVDITGKNVNVTINTNSGTIEGSTGESVSLPSDFPSDVYVIDGTIKTVVKKPETNSYSVSLETSKSAVEAKTLYETKLKESGWNVTFSMATDTGSTMSATKGTRNLSVIISTDEGKTTVILGTTENTQ